MNVSRSNRSLVVFRNLPFLNLKNIKPAITQISIKHSTQSCSIGMLKSGMSASVFSTFLQSAYDTMGFFAFLYGVSIRFAPEWLLEEGQARQQCYQGMP
jgi:hypothetical protein